MSNKVLFIDTETGGLNPQKNSLLSVGLVVWENGVIKAKKEIFIRNENYVVSPYALKFNNMNLSEVYDLGLSGSKFESVLNEFLNSNFDTSKKVIIGGHNINFDVSFLKKYFENENLDFSSIFSHRYIDTSSICKFAYHSSLVEYDISSSDKAFEYFDIKVTNRHSALGDAEATAKLYSSLINLVSNSR